MLGNPDGVRKTHELFDRIGINRWTKIKGNDHRRTRIFRCGPYGYGGTQ
jgi:hypothetical protein